jgi:tetratricopeptide (TPR) repeat protein
MRLFRLSLLVSIILGSMPSFAGDPQWVEIRSPNFSVITDAGDKRGRDVALHFEQMRAVFGSLMTKAHVNLPVPLQIVAFRNSKEMRQMSPLFNGKPTEDAGLFQGGDDRSFIMLDMSVENPWTVVFHEYAHQLMNGNLSAHTDPWFEEGFAEYFASIEVDSKEARVGKIPEQTYRILQQMGMMPVGDLIRVRQNTKTYNESGDHRNVFYAESSLLVHYIYDNQLVVKLADYFDAVVNQKQPAAQAWQIAFGMPPAQFDKVLRNYLTSGRYKYYPIATPPGIVAAQFVETPITSADAHVVLADIDAHSPDYQARALGEFEAVLKNDPNNAAALRGMGFVYLRAHDSEHAGEFFRRAAARDTKDPRVHYYNALMMNQEGGVSGAKAEEIKKELELAIALDPQLADAYSLLAYAQATSGDPAKGLVTMKKAVELSPRNETYQLNLANIYMANRKMNEAIAVLRNLLGSSNAQVAAGAHATLAQAEDFKERSKSFHPQLEVRTGEAVATMSHSSDMPEGKTEHAIEVESAPAAIPSSPPAPVRFVKGKLTGVDCSVAPQALLSVVSGGRPLKLHIGDKSHVVLIGADQFSCDWKDKSVSLNYRERGPGEGDVVSLEVQ